MTILSLRDVGKAFRTYKSEWHRFSQWFGLYHKPADEHWVLRHINFDVKPGEAIGIIGQNGAGKSTLLKIVTGTLRSTEGCVQIRGRIAAILELGMGFNPELTGRQNAYHAAGLMGFNNAEIERAMPDIEAFAEIGEYFDEPVRIYSSGMQVRLAFAVATAYRPDVLIVDEALSVGDAYFQHKSFDRIREFQSQGTTLLVVSHDKSAIQTLCDRALLLDQGKLLKDAEPEAVIDYYNALMADREGISIKTTQLSDGSTQTRSGTGEAQITQITLFNSENTATDLVHVGERVRLNIKVMVNQEIPSLVLGYGIRDRLGQVLFGTNTWHTKQVITNPNVASEYEFDVEFSANFGAGSYSVQTALIERDTHLSANYEWRDLALLFNVVNANEADFIGLLWNEPIIEIKRIA